MEITFEEDYVSDSGKKIPLDGETEQPHECIERRRATSKSKIYFDPEHINEFSKKMIPMEVATGERHKCKGK